MTQRILAVLAGAMVAFALGGWGRTVEGTGSPDAQTAAAVRALGDSEQPVPAGFASARGYEPEAVRLPSGDLVPVTPHGGCSSPIGGSPYGFSDACRQHDLGYDLLRYAEAEGHALGPWARKAIDAQFARQTFGACGEPGCWLLASVYVGAVEFNSWRQGYGAPHPESLAALLGPVAAGVLTGGALWTLLRRNWDSIELTRPVLAGAR